MNLTAGILDLQVGCKAPPAPSFLVNGVETPSRWVAVYIGITSVFYAVEHPASGRLIHPMHTAARHTYFGR